MCQWSSSCYCNMAIDTFFIKNMLELKFKYMKVAIIGAGNMGGAIARGMAQGSLIRPVDITVSNPSEGKLRAIKEFNPQIKTTCNNQEAINEADLIILTVKPWFIKEVIEGLTLQTENRLSLPLQQEYLSLNTSNGSEKRLQSSVSYRTRQYHRCKV